MTRHASSLMPLLRLACSSEHFGLFHDAQQLLLAHLSNTISVSCVIHVLQFLIGHPLTQSKSLQMCERMFTSFAIIEQAEGLHNLVIGIPVEDLV